MPDQKNFSAEVLQTAHEEALKKNRLLRWDEDIAIGDEFMRLKGHPVYGIHKCSHICLFSKRLLPADPFQQDISPEYAVKVIPTPQPNQRTLEDRLQMLEDNIRSLHKKLDQFLAESRRYS